MLMWEKEIDRDREEGQRDKQESLKIDKIQEDGQKAKWCEGQRDNDGGMMKVKQIKW